MKEKFKINTNMLYKLSFKSAINAMLVILSMVIFFHGLVLIQIIPYTIVWAGKIDNVNDMQFFELVSIIINVLIIIVIAIKGNYITLKVPENLIRISLWLLVVLFSLNTIGNLFAKFSFETIVFTPLTLIMTILCLRIVLEKNSIKE